MGSSISQGTGWWRNERSRCTEALTLDPVYAGEDMAGLIGLTRVTGFDLDQGLSGRQDATLSDWTVPTGQLASVPSDTVNTRHTGGDDAVRWVRI
jgi:hypothetical protein